MCDWVTIQHLTNNSALYWTSKLKIGFHQQGLIWYVVLF